MQISILRDLSIILLSAKLFGLVAKKLKAPQVVGQILAGLVCGPCLLGWVQESAFISDMAEIGVILVMFSAGLTTDLRELIKTGPVALLLACAGVFVPLAMGTALYMLFFGASAIGSEAFFKAVFFGTIMTATSVSITVASLQEMGRLKGRVGQTILSAAVIDDVIGIIVLTFVIGFKDPTQNAGTVVLHTVEFFAVSILGGILTYHIFKYLDKRYEGHRRMTIMALALCFSLSFIAQDWFGIADITGAYVAGIIVCNLKDAQYIERRIDINSYTIFAPLFFFSIGMKTTFEGMDATLIGFSIAFVAVALVSKIVGCGLVAKACRFTWKDSLKIGVGMMTRGEVALIVSRQGMAAGMMESRYFMAVILLILVSSVSVPVILKFLFKGEPQETAAVQA